MIPAREIAQADVTIGFDTSSRILVDRVHAAGRCFVLDQSIAHPRTKGRIYDQIRQKFPEWADDLDERDEEVLSSEDVEHQRSDCIAVASSFTKRSLVENGVADEKIVINPYGVDLARFKIKPKRETKKVFRFLFAGLVSARKGIPLLMEAWSKLAGSDAELILAGPLTNGARRELKSVGDRVKIVGKVPNAELAELMADCDVFVFPSYFEGFALVLLEAMASGLPVITTTATAGPDIISEGEDGWIIEPGDVEALVERMRCCVGNRVKMHAMRGKARAKAEQFSWDAYGERWVQILQEACS